MSHPLLHLSRSARPSRLGEVVAPDNVSTDPPTAWRQGYDEGLSRGAKYLGGAGFVGGGFLGFVAGAVATTLFIGALSSSGRRSA